MKASPKQIAQGKENLKNHQGRRGNPNGMTTKKGTVREIVYVKAAKTTITVDRIPRPKATRKQPYTEAQKAVMYKPGQSGNPAGRPLGSKSKHLTTITSAYDGLLKDQCSIEGFEELTWAEAIALGQMTAAQGGSTFAASHIADRTEGKVPEKREITGKDGEPLQSDTLVIKYVDASGKVTKEKQL